MKFRLNYIFILIIIVFVLSFIPTTVFAQDTPTITAPYGILMDYETGKVLFDKNSHQQAYPASTTKIMTAILVLENANLADKVTIDYDLYVDGSSMYLLKGESFTVGELLNALLIRSANDTAEALAIHVAGSVDKFVEIMNSRAKELGALNTNFTNPHGLPDPNHVTTAYDLAIIARHAMKFDVFREIVSTTSLSFEPTEQTPETRIYRNTNRFLWGTGRNNQILYNGQYKDIKYDIIDGIKTGYTNAAKQCLVSSSVKDNRRLISVVLGSEGLNIYSDSRSLIDYGYENFKLIELNPNKLEQLNVPIKDGKADNIELVTETNEAAIILFNQDPNSIIEKITINDNIKAPVNKGDILGKISYYLDDEIIGEANLIAKYDIEKKSLIVKLLKPSKFFIVFLGLFALWQVFVAYLRVKKKRRRVSYRKNPTVYNFNRNLFK